MRRTASCSSTKRTSCRGCWRSSLEALDLRPHRLTQRHQARRGAHHHGEVLDQAVSVHSQQIESLQLLVTNACAENERVRLAVPKLVGVLEVLERLRDRAQHARDGVFP